MVNTNRVLVFVDEANVMAAAQKSSKRFDWPKLREYLVARDRNRELTEMVIYIGLPPVMDEFQPQRQKKERFLHWLRTQGFMVVTKNGTPTSEGHFRSNVDVMMAIDALEFAADTRPDVVVLVTGDSDFAHLAHKLRRRGTRVEVAAVRTFLSGELEAAANCVIDLAPLVNSFDVLQRTTMEVSLEGLGEETHLIGMPAP